jgi:peroxiredoxin
MEGGSRPFGLIHMTASQEPEEIVPDFRLPASTGHELELGSFLGKVPILFVFLDPGASQDRELLAVLNERLREFGEQRSQVLVVMRITAGEATQMSEEDDLAVPILADANGGMARDFGLEREGGSAAFVADRTGKVVRRFHPLPDDDPGEIAESLLSSIRDSTIAPNTASTGEEILGDREFFALIAEEARVSEEEAPVLVSEFLEALAPALDREARRVVDDLLPENLSVPETGGSGGEDVKGVLLGTFEESSVAIGRPAEHARVVAEALARRATPAQLERLQESIADDDVLALFETHRGDLTRMNPTSGAPHQVDND